MAVIFIGVLQVLLLTALLQQSTSPAWRQTREKLTCILKMLLWQTSMLRHSRCMAWFDGWRALLARPAGPGMP